MGSDQELDYNPGPAMKRFGGRRHYLPRPNPIGTIDRIQLTLCREVVCSHWLVVDGWGALLGELCSCLSILFASTSFLFNTPIPASTSRPPNRRVIWGRGHPQGTQSRRRSRSRKWRSRRWLCAETIQTSTQGLAGFRRDEFRQLQAWREKSD